MELTLLPCASMMPASQLPSVIDLHERLLEQVGCARALLDAMEPDLVLHDPVDTRAVTVLERAPEVLSRMAAEAERVFHNTEFNPVTQQVNQGNATATLVLSLGFPNLGLVGTCESRSIDQHAPEAQGKYKDSEKRHDNVRKCSLDAVPDLAEAQYLCPEDVDTMKVLWHFGQISRLREEMNQNALLNAQIERMLWGLGRTALVIPGDKEGKTAALALAQMATFQLAVDGILQNQERTYADLASAGARDKLIAAIARLEGTALPYRTPFTKGSNKTTREPTWKITTSCPIASKFGIRKNPTPEEQESCDKQWKAVGNIYVWRWFHRACWAGTAFDLNAPLPTVDRYAAGFIDFMRSHCMDPQSSESIQILDREGRPVLVDRPGKGLTVPNVLEYAVMCLPEQLRNAVAVVTCNVRYADGAYYNPKSVQVVVPGNFVYGVAKGKRPPTLVFPHDDVRALIRDMTVAPKGRNVEEDRKRNTDGLDTNYAE